MTEPEQHPVRDDPGHALAELGQAFAWGYNDNAQELAEAYRLTVAAHRSALGAKSYAAELGEQLAAHARPG